MKNNLLIFFLLILFFTYCTNNKKSADPYAIVNYSRLTTDSDSISNKYVVYRSILDTNRLILKQYWDNGKLQSRDFFYGKNRDGHWITYFDDGNISFEGDFHDNLKTGTHKIYFENGRVSILKKFQDGKQIGLWRYDSSGNSLETDSL